MREKSTIGDTKMSDPQFRAFPAAPMAARCGRPSRRSRPPMARPAGSWRSQKRATSFPASVRVRAGTPARRLFAVRDAGNFRYLDRALPRPALTPAEIRVAARMDQVMNVCDWYLFHGVANVIGFQRIIRPRFSGLADRGGSDNAGHAASAYGVQRARALAWPKPYFTGDTLSLADLLVAPQLDFLNPRRNGVR